MDKKKLLVLGTIISMVVGIVMGFIEVRYASDNLKDLLSIWKSFLLALICFLSIYLIKFTNKGE